MANIDIYLQKILSAIYGEEVRGSIHDSLFVMNNEVISNLTDVKKNLIMVSKTQPTNPNNQIYVDPVTQEVVVPDWDDFQQVLDEAEKVEQFDGRITELKEDLNEVDFRLSEATTKDGERVTKDITTAITWYSGRYLDDGSYDGNNYYKNSGRIKCKGGDKFTLVSSLNILNAVMFNGNKLVDVRGKNSRSFTVADGATSVIISCVSSNTITSVKVETNNIINSALEYIYSTNLFDVDKFTTGKAMRNDGVLVDYTGGYTDYVSVHEGDTVLFGDGYNSIRYVRFITAFDENFNVLPSKGSADGGTKYIVPSGVKYIRLSIQTSNIKDDSRINISTELLKYEPFEKRLGAPLYKNIEDIEYNQKYRPYSTFNHKKLNGDSYKPMGGLSQPYFCLVSDDGYEGVATYSIPMVISKNVPMTFGIMKGSPVLEEPYLTTLKDAIANHGCTVAQHGFTRFTEYTEAQLNAFFDDEEAYFDSIGLEIKGAICPGHNISKLVSAVAGNRYGVLRTGYNGNGETDAVIPKYGWYMNGAKSNLYAIDCFGISTEPLSDQKSHIDYAVENNMLIVGFYHEWELTTETTAQVEAVIDYAKQKGMTFCTLDEIPKLV